MPGTCRKKLKKSENTVVRVFSLVCVFVFDDLYWVGLIFYFDSFSN